MTDTKKEYSLMLDFYRRGMEFLFRQSPVIVLAVLVLYMQWVRSEKMDLQMVQYRIEFNKQHSDAMANVRAQLELCNIKNDLLNAQVKEQAVELAGIKAVVKQNVLRIGQSKNNAPFGVKN